MFYSSNLTNKSILETIKDSKNIKKGSSPAKQIYKEMKNSPREPTILEQERFLKRWGVRVDSIIPEATEITKDACQVTKFPSSTPRVIMDTVLKKVYLYDENAASQDKVLESKIVNTLKGKVGKWTVETISNLNKINE